MKEKNDRQSNKVRERERERKFDKPQKRKTVLFIVDMLALLKMLRARTIQTRINFHLSSIHKGNIIKWHWVTSLPLPRHQQHQTTISLKCVTVLRLQTKCHSNYAHQTKKKNKKKTKKWEIETKEKWEEKKKKRI